MKRFDTIVRSLTAAVTRRGVLGFLAALPLLAGLVAPEDEVEAAKRRRRGQRGKQAGHGRHLSAEKKRKKKKKCKPKSQTSICAGKCGAVKNNCKRTVDCGSCACPAPCDACFICQEGVSSQGSCVVDPDQEGEACGACATCDGSGQCMGCDAGFDCCGAGCVDQQSDPEHCGSCGAVCGTGQICQDGVCGFTCGGDFCPAATEICDGGTCQDCDVCVTCDHPTVQEAIDDAIAAGGTVRICAGAYTRLGHNPVGDVRLGDLTLVGAGAEATLLDGGGINSDQPVLFVRDSTCVMRQLTIIGGRGAPGIWISSASAVTLADVIVSANLSFAGAGIFNESELTLNAGTIVRGNGATDDAGGGIYNAGEQARLTLNDGARVTGNTAQLSGGGVFNGGGVVTLNAGSEVSGNDALGGAGGMANIEEGIVTLHLGSRVCGNAIPQCTGFDDPLEICQDTCA